MTDTTKFFLVVAVMAATFTLAGVLLPNYLAIILVPVALWAGYKNIFHQRWKNLEGTDLQVLGGLLTPLFALILAVLASSASERRVLEQEVRISCGVTREDVVKGRHGPPYLVQTYVCPDGKEFILRKD